jgi:chemosensory pili system protein ChpA (sensor histidine kinase/response regulator)
VESVAGVGTKFTLCLPLTLLISTALLVRVGTQRYAIPLQSVREVTMPFPSSVQQVADRTMLQVGEEAVEVRTLHEVLGQEAPPVGAPTPIVLVRTTAGVQGFVVDELLGRQEIVIKKLGSLKALERSHFGGATIDPEGRVVLVLDVGRLGGKDQGGAFSALDAPEAQYSEPDLPALPDLSEERPSEELPLLLVDDSLSVRKFVSRMLESAGYEVETAVDGEEGLRMANERGYRLIITDLEMPKMNGYEVIQALRSRPQTQKVPIMVMTTRAGDKHRQMAMNIGANAYIAKPVEERALIREVQRWVGREAGVKS